MDVTPAVTLIEYLWNQKSIAKLSVFLMELPVASFREVVLIHSPTLHAIFCQESLTEPIQHQLTLLHHELSAELSLLEVALISMEKNIALLDLEKLGQNDLVDLNNSLAMLTQKYQQKLSVLEAALSLAWNTTRADLIDKLSNLKEQYERALYYVIGHPRYSMLPATGLYATLEERLYSVYEDPSEVALQDEDHAIEGLTKLGICDPKEYLAIGLLPQLKGKQQSHLFQLVKHELEKRGLHTVGSLKEALIFSKKTLVEYLVRKLES